VSLPPKPKTCAIQPCGNRSEVPLQGKPSGIKADEQRVFWFCRHCAPAYERMGYKPLAQGSFGL
jgi:hypothetical protein